MRGMYVLDKDGNPEHTEDAVRFLDWFEKNSAVVGDTFVGQTRVLTVFLGVDSTVGHSCPLVFATGLELADGSSERWSAYPTRQAALAGHREAVRAVQRVIIGGRAPTLESISEDMQGRSPYLFEREIQSVYLAEGRTYEEAVIRATCDASGYGHLRQLGDAGWVAIRPLMYTHAIVSEITSLGHEGRWCYKDYPSAKAALDAWDGTGEPSGWFRHPLTGRRVDDDGREYVSL